jgi:DME family drug/metabolite transporter
MRTASGGSGTGTLKDSLCVIGAACLWGMIGLYTRPLGNAGISSLQITFLRNFFATIYMALFLAVRHRELFRIEWRDFWMFLCTGIVSQVFFNICYFSAIARTTMSAAAVLLYTAPCIVLILSAVFFHEKLTGRKIIALAASFVGCIFTTGLIGSASALSTFGILLGLGAGLGYALYSIFSKIALRKYHPYTVTFYTTLCASLFLLPLSHPGSLTELLGGRNVLATALALGFFSTLMPAVLYSLGLRGMDAGRAAVMAYAEPLVATLCGLLFYQEKLSLSNVTGMVMILLSLLLMNFPRRSDRRPAAGTDWE